VFIFISRYSVSGKPAEFERILDRISTYMAERPGRCGHRLYRSAKDENVYVETAEWIDAQAHRAACSTPTFQALIAELKEVAVAEPGPFTLVRQTAGNTTI
jgi:long-chain acyl-CoA synthetase